MPAAYIIKNCFVEKRRSLYMEFTFSQLKQKDVISLNDGKNLGRVCDITFCYPDNELLGITVTGCKGFRFSKQEIFIPMRQVVKIGADTVLVNGMGGEKCPPPPPPKPCPPNNYPPNNCPPNNPPPKRPPNNCPPNNCPPDRRSYDEYE